jgi:hypothetical protein
MTAMKSVAAISNSFWELIEDNTIINTTINAQPICIYENETKN